MNYLGNRDQKSINNDPSKQLQMTDEEVEKGLEDYFYVRDGVFYGTNYIKAWYYIQHGKVIENIRAGVIILTKQGDDVYICLVKENAIEQKWQKWGIPKGGVESGYSITGSNDSEILNSTARREIFEELNYEIDPIELGRCTTILIDVPQRRDTTVDRKKMFVGGKVSDDPSIVKHTLNFYFLYAMDGDKRGFDVNDPYKGRKDVSTVGRLDQRWLKLDPTTQIYNETYDLSNKSTQLTLKALVCSKDGLIYS